ncbi:hypothetical protein BRADI_1g24796v3 [Brachypodium distachyon]|uniref:Uncharacterized protein n=1 Tax=Brachypodium distachyon TaxID=15368 RepID=A0A2K2DKZ4_BRADI|nr:hypothetical protein BRADI_1g24796v3 [Brachypodium distachyon]
MLLMNVKPSQQLDLFLQVRTAGTRGRWKLVIKLTNGSFFVLSTQLVLIDGRCDIANSEDTFSVGIIFSSVL